MTTCNRTARSMHLMGAAIVAVALSLPVLAFAAADTNSDKEAEATDASTAAAVEVETPEWAQGAYENCLTCHANITDGCEATDEAAAADQATDNQEAEAAENDEEATAADDTEAATEATGDEEDAAEADETNACCLYALHADLSCVSCHNDEKLADVHESPDMTKLDKLSRLIKSKVSPDLCITCHDTEELAEITADPEVALTDSHDNVVNPHALPDKAEHEKVTCMSCHKFHDEDSTPREAAEAYCKSCHHEGIYECNTCHS